MTVTDSSPTTDGAESTWVDDLRSFLDDNWDPDLTVGDWWERLGAAGWSAPLLPADAYGRGLDRAHAMLAARIIADSRAPGAPVGTGTPFVAPPNLTPGPRGPVGREPPGTRHGPGGG